LKIKIFITGGAGFVGSNLAIKLKKEHPAYEIFVLDNLTRRGSELNLSRFRKFGITFIHGDIRNREDFEKVPKFDLMIECSAEPSVLAGVDGSPGYLLNTNLVGSLNCFEEVRKNNAKIIFLSTSRVYPIENINALDFLEKETRFEVIGEYKHGIAENFSLNGARSLYGATKLCSEIILQEYIAAYKIKGVINRCGILTGPWQMGKVDQGVIMLWVAKHFFKKELTYFGFNGSGKQVRDFLHIDDFFRLIDLQVNDFNKFKNQVFNIGGGLSNSVSLLELTRVCQDSTGNKINIGRVAETRPNDLKWYVTNINKISALCGWRPKKDLASTVYDIVKWIKENKYELMDILE